MKNFSLLLLVLMINFYTDIAHARKIAGCSVTCPNGTSCSASGKAAQCTCDEDGNAFCGSGTPNKSLNMDEFFAKAAEAKKAAVQDGANTPSEDRKMGCSVWCDDGSGCRGSSCCECNPADSPDASCDASSF